MATFIPIAIIVAGLGLIIVIYALCCPRWDDNALRDWMQKSKLNFVLAFIMAFTCTLIPFLIVRLIVEEYRNYFPNSENYIP